MVERSCISEVDQPVCRNRAGWKAERTSASRPLIRSGNKKAWTGVSVIPQLLAAALYLPAHR